MCAFLTGCAVCLIRPPETAPPPLIVAIVLSHRFISVYSLNSDRTGLIASNGRQQSQTKTGRRRRQLWMQTNCNCKRQMIASEWDAGAKVSLPSGREGHPAPPKRNTNDEKNHGLKLTTSLTGRFNCQLLYLWLTDWLSLGVSAGCRSICSHCFSFFFSNVVEQ